MPLTVQCPMCGLDISSGGEAKELLLSLSEHKQRVHNMPAMSSDEMERMMPKIRGTPPKPKAKSWWRRVMK